MVVEGEEVQASLVLSGDSGRIDAVKRDGSAVLTGTASIGPEHQETELQRRMDSLGDPGELYIIDRLSIGETRQGTHPLRITRAERNGAGYPFSLDDKLARITEPHPWYTPEGGAASPWGRAVVPMEMISVLANKTGRGLPVRGPALGQSRRTESYWTRSTLTDASTGRATAVVLLHSGVFKDSYPEYPTAASAPG